MMNAIIEEARENLRRAAIGIGVHGLDGLARLADLADPLELTLDRLAAVAVPSAPIPDQGTPAARPPSAEAVEEPIAPGPSAIFLDEGPPPTLDLAL
jgi:hypothetical protein